MNRDAAIQYMREHADKERPCSTRGLCPPAGWSFVSGDGGCWGPKDWYLMCKVDNDSVDGNDTAGCAPIFDADIEMS